MSATTLPTSQPSAPAPKRRRPFRWPQLGYSYPVVGVMVAGGIGGFVWVYGMLEKSRGLTGAHFRIDLSPLLAANWIIQTHVAGAVTAFLLGLVILFLPKGVRLHRQMGWAWVVAMGTAAVASIFIRTNNGQFSWIHTFTALTLVMLPMAVAAARMHYAKIHARFMTAVFLGGAFTAGLFTFLPGRLMWEVLFTTGS
jgi:uncharacterized membrane protein/nitrate reductase NapE component